MAMTRLVEKLRRVGVRKLRVLTFMTELKEGDLYNEIARSLEHDLRALSNGVLYSVTASVSFKGKVFTTNQSQMTNVGFSLATI